MSTNVTGPTSPSPPSGSSQRRRPRLLWVVVGVVLAVVAISSVTGFSRYSDFKRANESASDLWQISMGILSYQDVHKRNVDDVRDKNGKPILSWRVEMLPYIEQLPLYVRFNRDEPWDSPHNLELLAEMPTTYRHPTRPEKGETETFYQLITGPRTLFEGAGNKQLTASNVTDGLDSTALLFEAEQPVPWTKPADLVYTPGTRLPALRRSYNGYLVAFADGMVRTVPYDTSEESLTALITPRGGEPVSIEQFPKNRHVVELNERLEKFMDGMWGR